MPSAVKCPSGRVNTVKWECNQMSAIVDLQVVICQRGGGLTGTFYALGPDVFRHTVDVGGLRHV